VEKEEGILKKIKGMREKTGRGLGFWLHSTAQHSTARIAK
jgi:hypothetical protein